jgi:hypothetical protein
LQHSESWRQRAPTFLHRPWATARLGVAMASAPPATEPAITVSARRRDTGPASVIESRSKLSSFISSSPPIPFACSPYLWKLAAPPAGAAAAFVVSVHSGVQTPPPPQHVLTVHAMPEGHCAELVHVCRSTHSAPCPQTQVPSDVEKVKQFALVPHEAKLVSHVPLPPEHAPTHVPPEHVPEKQQCVAEPHEDAPAGQVHVHVAVSKP